MQNDREFVVESTLERRVLYCALATRDIVEIRDQWPVVPYRMPDGRKGTHTFDFWFRYASGARRCIAVRTRNRVESEFRGAPSLAAMLEAVSKADLSVIRRAKLTP